jgi:hypothetical protein
MSLTCWRRRLGALGPRGATGSRQVGRRLFGRGLQIAGAAAPDGGGTSRRRPRSPLQRQSHGDWFWPCMWIGWRFGDLCGQRVCRPGWFIFGQCEVRTGSYVGATAPEMVVCVCCALGAALCGRRVSSHVWLFGRVSLINRSVYSLYGFWTRFSL